MILTDIPQLVCMYEQKEERDVNRWNMERMCSNFYNTALPILRIARKNAHSKIRGLEKEIAEKKGEGIKTDKISKNMYQTKNYLSSIGKTIEDMSLDYLKEKSLKNKFQNMNMHYRDSEEAIKELTKIKEVLPIFERVMPNLIPLS